MNVCSSYYRMWRIIYKIIYEVMGKAICRGKIGKAMDIVFT